MKAVVCDRYGPPEVLHLEDVPRPVPAADEVLIRVRATTVTRTDDGMRKPYPWFARLLGYGLRRPRRRILGVEVAGVVEEVGAAVNEFQAGDRVFGHNSWRFGAHAEFVCMRESAALAQMPVGAKFREVAPLCDGPMIAVKYLKAANVGMGQRIAVYGASGSFGTACVQLARYFGAHVTAVCNTKNVDVVRSLGADDVIDYTKQDFTNTGERYDAIIDAVGKLPFSRCSSALTQRGAYLPSDHLRNLALVAWTSRRPGKHVLFPIPPQYAKKDAEFIRGLFEAGKYRAIIDRCYTLDQVVEATRYVASAEKTGNVVLIVGSEAQ